MTAGNKDSLAMTRSVGTTTIGRMASSAGRDRIANDAATSVRATVLQARVTRFSGANEGVHDSCEDEGRDHDRINRMAEGQREPYDGCEKKEDDPRRSRRTPEPGNQATSTASLDGYRSVWH